jgi:parallel beta-helix repeat protein
MLKKILFVIVCVSFVSGTALGQALSGTYYIGDEGTAPGGVDPHYSNLKAAADNLMAEGIAGDVTFLITSNLTEAQNVFLGFDAHPHTVTFRPAPATTPTITFTSTTGNSSLAGALVIGATSDSFDDLTLTRNIIIDGSATVGENNRDLSFIASLDANTSNYFRVIGNVQDVTIRNSNFEVQQLSFDVLRISPLRRNDIDYVPDNLIIEDNELSVNPARTLSRAINIWGVVDEPQILTENGVIIRNNIINSTRYGIWLRENVGNTTIENNEFYMNENGTGDTVNPVALYVHPDGNSFALISDNAVININSNKFVELNSARRMRAIFTLSRGKFNITNNSITGFSRTGTSTLAAEFTGIQINVPAFPTVTEANIYNNTILMETLGGNSPASSWNYYGIYIHSFPRITANVRNNIVINNDNSAVSSYAYFQGGSAAANLTMDYNLWYGSNIEAASNTYLFNHAGTNYETLDAFQTAVPALNANSISKVVNFVSSSDLNLTGASDGDNDLAGTPIATVTHDAAGTFRNPFSPYMGAYEATALSPSVLITGDAGWRLMSAPADNFTIQNLMNQTGIQGVEGAENGTEFTPNIITGYNGTDWVYPTNVSDVLASGTGFALTFYNNDIAGSRTLPARIFAPGNTPTSDVTVNDLHSNGDRFNLLGNPFNAPIEMSELTAVSGTLAAHGQVWVDGEGESAGGEATAGSWVLTSTAPFNGFLPAWQGFMLQNDETDPASGITFPTAAIAEEESITFQKATSPNHRMISFKLNGTDQSDGYRFTDRAASIYFHPEADYALNRHDVTKLAPLTHRAAILYFSKPKGEESRLLAQFALPFDIDEPVTIPLDVHTYGASGSFTISWPQLVNVDSRNGYILLDTHTGDEIDLLTNESYAFNVETTMQKSSPRNASLATSSDKESRFKLIIEPPVTTSLEADQNVRKLELAQNYPNPFNPTTTIRFNLPQSMDVSLVVYDMIGRQVAELVNGQMASGNHTVSFNASALSSGVYIYRLKSAQEQISRQMVLIK